MQVAYVFSNRETYLGGDRTGDLYGGGGSRARLLFLSRSFSRGSGPLGDWLREYDRDLLTHREKKTLRFEKKIVVIDWDIW